MKNGVGAPVKLALGAFLIYIAFLPPGIYSIDGNSMLAVADSIVSQHNFTVPTGLGIIGRNGRTYSSWYPLQSLLAVPVVAVALVASHLLHLPTHYVEALFALTLPPLWTAATVGFVYLIALALRSSKTGAWIAAVSYAFGTIALVYARSFFAEPLLALLTAASLYFAFMEAALPAAILVALAVLAKPTGILVGPVLTAYLILKGHRWESLLPTIGSSVGLALYFFYNFERFGNALAFGQPWSTFSLSSIPEGIAGLLVSPGAGLIWFCPCAVLAIEAIRTKENRLEALAVLAIFVGFVALHSYWSAWSGGWSWGPRLLLPALPGIIALAGTLNGKWQKALAALAFLGFLLTAPTLVSFYERYFAEATEAGLSNTSLLWAPLNSPLAHAWPAAIRQIRDASGHNVQELFRERGTPAVTIATSRALRIVAVWWWVLPVAHIRRLLGLAISILLIGSGGSLVVRAFPGLRATSEMIESPLSATVVGDSDVRATRGN